MTPCDDPYPWLADFLCDYVDGEMPPTEKAAFEEWLRGDPRLAAHVSGLVRTRRLCCQSQAPKAPCDFVSALHQRLVAEGLEEPRVCVRPKAHGTTRRTAYPEVPVERHDPAGTALLMRSALLLIVLGAVVIARFGLHVEAEQHRSTAAVATASTGALAALAPEPERPIEIVPLSQTPRRPAQARLVRAHAELRPAAARATTRPAAAVRPVAVSSDALLRIRAGY